jgi:hypothetical protein
MTFSAALAQTFSVGESVICKPTGSESDWREGIVTENNPKLSYIRIKCGPAKNGNPGGIFLVDRRDARKMGDAEAQQKSAGIFPGSPGANSLFQVGQSVMCLPTGTERDVRPGKILENNPTLNYVRIQCPPGSSGQPGGIFLVSRKDVWLPNAGGVPVQAPQIGVTATAQAPPQAVASVDRPSSPAPPSRVDSPAANQNSAATTKANCACPSQTQVNGNSIEDNIKETIIARYVRNGGALDAYHTPSTVHFNSFQIVRKRPYAMPIPGAYHTGSPDGPGGTMGTQVYEVVCKYTVCTDYPGSPISGYRGRIYMVDHDAGYTCFIDTKGSWRCNQSKDSMTSRELAK